MLRHRRLAAVGRRVVGGPPEHLGAIAADPRQRQPGGPDVAGGDGEEAHVVRAAQRNRGLGSRRGLRAVGNGRRQRSAGGAGGVRNRRRDRFGMGRPSAPRHGARVGALTQLESSAGVIASRSPGIALEDPVRIAVIASLVLVATVRIVGQQPAPPPTDRTKATRFSAEDLRAGLAKLPDRSPVGGGAGVLAGAVQRQRRAAPAARPGGLAARGAGRALLRDRRRRRRCSPAAPSPARPAPGPTWPAPASRAVPGRPSARATSSWCRRGCRTSSSTSRPRCT